MCVLIWDCSTKEHRQHPEIDAVEPLELELLTIPDQPHDSPPFDNGHDISIGRGDERML